MKRLFAFLLVALALGLPAAPVFAVCNCYDPDDSAESTPNGDEFCTEVCGTGGVDDPTSESCDCGGTSESYECADLCAYEGLTSEPPTSDTTTPTEPVKNPVTPQLNVNIPGVSFTEPLQRDGKLESNFIADYVTGVYRYLLGIAVTIAIVFVMIGGLQYVLAAGTGDTSKAKARIRNSVVGLVLLFCVYVILYTVNPQLTLFKTLSLTVIPQIPLENIVEGDDEVACTQPGAELYGVNDFQDCMLKTYGESEESVKSQLVSITYKSRSYQIHQLAATDFQNALAAIDASGVDYDITSDAAGGTFNWRCNKNNLKAISSHSWGTAIDINPGENPNCPSGCTDGNASTACNCVTAADCEQQCASGSYDLPPEVISAFESNGFNWLGDGKSVKDYMHFTYTKVCKGG